LRAGVSVAAGHMAAYKARCSCNKCTQFVFFPSRRSVTEIFAEETIKNWEPVFRTAGTRAA
jgi:hypothetical protein